MSHTIQQVLSWEELWSSWALHTSLPDNFVSTDMRSFSFAVTCFSSTGHWAWFTSTSMCLQKVSLLLAGLSDKRDFHGTALPVGFLLLWDQLRAEAGLDDQTAAHPAAKWTLITCLRTFRFPSFGSLCLPELECNYSYLLWLAAHELLSCTSSTIWHLFVPN